MIDNITLKFEDLVGLRGEEIRGSNLFFKCFNKLFGSWRKFDIDKISIIAKNSFGVSGTFRKGKLEHGRKFFRQRQKNI